MTVLAIGLNHHSAPLDVRARFAFTPERLPAALRSLRERLARAASEATLLSTCNRTELYVAAGDAAAGAAPADLAQPALAWLAEQDAVAARGDTVRLLNDQLSGVAAMVQSSRTLGIVRGSVTGDLTLDSTNTAASLSTGTANDATAAAVSGTSDGRTYRRGQ